ncbi:MAG: DNA alkylation repair protein [Verrucomicrobia bacterium Tous-C9LFEB]|nr:MAG: DNA alkylation repair protein [Verrucomicrobia bacterium Tous-C9LFEB]
MNLKASDVAKALRAVARPEKVSIYQSFFKTGPGQYGEGDRFIGVTVPNSRAAIKPFLALPMGEVETLLASVWHEERFAAALILVAQFERGDAAQRRSVFDFYLAKARRLNNWDLVDCSTPQVVGGWLYEQGKGWAILRKLARSENLWERRISILATFYYIRQREMAPTVEIAELLLGDRHDLIHKAVGWMLREMGKREVTVLESFLDRHGATMPRTMLRYAIEKFPEKRRKLYLGLKASA